MNRVQCPGSGTCTLWTRLQGWGDPILLSHRSKGTGKELDPRSDSRSDSLPTRRSGAGGVSVCFSPAHLDHLLPEPGPKPGCCRKSMNIIPERVPVVSPGTTGFIWMHRQVLQTLASGITSISWVPPIHPPRASASGTSRGSGVASSSEQKGIQRHPPGRGPLLPPSPAPRKAQSLFKY